MNSVIGALRVILGLDSAAFEQGARGAEARMGQLGKNLQSFGNKMTGFITAPLALAGTAVTAALSGMADDINGLQNSARLAGAGFEEFQKLAFAAKSVGIQSDKLGDIYKDVNDKVGDFLQNGGGEMADFFKNIAPKVGLTAEAFRNLSGPAALQLYYNGLQKAGLSQAEMTFYMEAIGDEASALIPLLANNGAEMGRLGERASELGAVFSNETGEQASKFNTAMTELGASLRGLGVVIANSGLIEWVTLAVQKIRDVTAIMSQTNPEIVKWGVVVGGVAAVLGPMTIALGLAVSAIAAIGVPVVAAVAAGTALAAAAVAIYTNWERIKASFPLVGQAVETTLSVMKVSFTGLVENARLMATGVAQLLTGDFAGAWTSAQALVHNFWQTLGSIADTILPGFTARLSEISQEAMQVAGELVQAFVNLPAQMLEIGGQIIDGLWQGIKAKWDEVKANVTGLANSIADWFRTPLDIHSPSRVMHEIGVNVMQGLNNGMTSMQGKAVGVASDTASQIKGTFDGIQGVGSGLGSGIESAFSGVGSSIADAIKGTKEWRDVALDALRSVANNLFSGMGSKGGGGFGGIFTGLLSGLFGFANGGEFRVGGAGGIDSQLVAFKASPNETVSITKPGQGRAGGSMVFAPVIHAPGADQAALARVSRRLDDMYDNFGKMVDGRQKTSNTRGVRG